MKKVLSLVLAVCLSCTLLVGYATDGTDLWDAYLKTAQYKSCAIDMSLKISADTSAVTDVQVKKVLDSVNGMVITMTGTSINDIEKGIMQAGVLMKSTYEGVEYNYNIWVDMDMSNKEQPKFNAIYEFPKINGLNFVYPKQYYSLDMTEMFLKSGLDLTKGNPFDTKSILESLSKMDTTGINVEKKDGIYTVKINSAAIGSLTKQYLNIIFSNPAISSIIPNEANDVITDTFNKLAKIDLLGGKDIVTIMTLNKDGYIEDMNTKLDLVIDPVQIGAAFDAPDVGTTDKYAFGLDMKYKYSNYNAITSVVFPTLTSENSASLNDLMKPAYESDEINVLVNNKKVAFDVPPQSVNDRTMVPMRAIFESLGATVNYDEATDTITAFEGNNTIIHKIGENVIYVNDKTLEMDVVSFTSNDRTLVPARFISEALGANVEWIEVANTVVITK